MQLSAAEERIKIRDRLVACAKRNADDAALALAAPKKPAAVPVVVAPKDAAAAPVIAPPKVAEHPGHVGHADHPKHAEPERADPEHADFPGRPKRAASLFTLRAPEPAKPAAKPSVSKIVSAKPAAVRQRVRVRPVVAKSAVKPAAVRPAASRRALPRPLAARARHSDINSDEERSANSSFDDDTSRSESNQSSSEDSNDDDDAKSADDNDSSTQPAAGPIVKVVRAAPELRLPALADSPVVALPSRSPAPPAAASRPVAVKSSHVPAMLTEAIKACAVNAKKRTISLEDESTENGDSASSESAVRHAPSAVLFANIIQGSSPGKPRESAFHSRAPEPSGQSSSASSSAKRTGSKVKEVHGMDPEQEHYEVSYYNYPGRRVWRSADFVMQAFGGREAIEAFMRRARPKPEPEY